MDVAVTDEPSAAPMEYVPPPYVPEDHVPMWVTAVEPAVEKVRAVELVFAPDDAAFQVQACRAYEPAFAFSEVPVVPGVAVCKLT